jgi:hypothetical protein
MLRIFIKHSLDIDVFKQYTNIVSISYYSFMSLFSKFSKDFLAECFVMFINENVLFMNGPGDNQGGGVTNPPANNPGGGNHNPAGNNPGAGNPNPAGNNPAGGNPQQLRANKTNGPIQVNDPNNQNFQYNPNGTNQPLLGNIARALNFQRSIGLSSLSRYTFTRDQEQFVLTFLLYNHTDVYNNIMQGQPGNINQPQW